MGSYTVWLLVDLDFARILYDLVNGRQESDDPRILYVPEYRFLSNMELF